MDPALLNVLTGCSASQKVIDKLKEKDITTIEGFAYAAKDTLEICQKILGDEVGYAIGEVGALRYSWDTAVIIARERIKAKHVERTGDNDLPLDSATRVELVGTFHKMYAIKFESSQTPNDYLLKKLKKQVDKNSLHPVSLYKVSSLATQQTMKQTTAASMVGGFRISASSHDLDRDIDICNNMQALKRLRLLMVGYSLVGTALDPATNTPQCSLNDAINYVLWAEEKILNALEAGRKVTPAMINAAHMQTAEHWTNCTRNEGLSLNQAIKQTRTAECSRAWLFDDVGKRPATDQLDSGWVKKMKQDVKAELMREMKTGMKSFMVPPDDANKSGRS